jgi:hypothetical protein
MDGTGRRLGVRRGWERTRHSPHLLAQAYQQVAPAAGAPKMLPKSLAVEAESRARTKGVSA